MLPRAARGEQCAVCHRGIDDAHPKKALACTAYHRGDARATEAKRAPAGIWVNPVVSEYSAEPVLVHGPE